MIVPLLFAGGLYGVLKVYATPDRIADLLSKEMGDALGIEVTLETVSPSLFPPGVAVEGVIFDHLAGGGGDPLGRLEKGKIELRILPLFSKRIEIAGAAMDGLHISIVQDEEGELILPEARKVDRGARGSLDEDGRSGSRGAGDFALFLSVGEIRNGSLVIKDVAGLEMIKIDTIDVTTSVEMESGGALLTAAGKVSLSGIRGGGLADAGYEAGFARLTMEHELSISPHDERAIIKRMDVAVGKVPFSVSGELLGFEGPPSGQLHIESIDLSLEELLALAPGSLDGPLKELSGSGPLSLAGDIKLQGEEPPTYRFVLELGGVDARLVSFPEPIRQIRGVMEATEKGVTLDGLSAEIGGRPLKIDGNLSRYDDPLLDATVKGEIDLAAVTRTGVLPEGAIFEGILSMDARAEGALLDPARMNLSGNISLAGGSAELPGLALPVTRLEARARLLGEVAEIDSFRLTAGRTDLLARLTINNPLGDANITMNASSSMIDLDQFFPSPEASLGVDSSAGAVVAPPVPIVPPIPELSGEGKIVADTLITGGNTLVGVVLDFTIDKGRATTTIQMRQGQFGEVTVREANTRLLVTPEGITGEVTADSALAALIPFSSARADVSINPNGNLDLTGVEADLYDGKVVGTVSVNLAEPGDPSYRFDVEATDLNANNFLSRISPAKNVLYGKFNMTSKWEGRGLEPEEFLKNLKASGSAVTMDGELKNLKAVNEVASFLGLNELKEQKFRSLHSGFRLEKGRFTTDEITMTSATASWLASGSVGFDGSLDYDISMTLSEAMSEKLKKKSSLSSLFADEKGRVVLDFNIDGTTKKPVVAYDLSKTTSRKGVGSIESIIEALDKDGAIQGAIDRLFGGGSSKKK